MSEPALRVQLTEDTTGFRPVALEPGSPVVDGCGNVFQILNEWLGDLVTIAEAEWDGKTLAFHVPISENERLVDPKCRRITGKHAKAELTETASRIAERVASVKPKTAMERLVHAWLLSSMGRPDAPNGTVLEDHFFQYEHFPGEWRLLWCWGYMRAEGKPGVARFCQSPACRQLHLAESTGPGICPFCAGAIETRPGLIQRVGLRNIALLLLCLLAATAFGMHQFGILGARIRVSVTDDQSGQPIPDATVQVNDDSDVVECDEAGQAILKNVFSRKIRVNVLAPGYGSESGETEGRLGRTSTLDLSLSPLGQVSGRVVSMMLDKPIQDAIVRVEGTDARQATTDADGQFSSISLVHGPAELIVSAEGFCEKRVPIDIAPGQAHEVEVRLVGDAMLVGTVKDAVSGKPISKAVATVIGTDVRSVTGDDGRFEVAGLQSGEASVRLSAPGYGTRQITCSLQADHRTETEITLAGAGSVQGRVLSSLGKKPLPGASVTLVGTPVGTTSDANGNFALPSLPPEQLTLLVSRSGYRDRELSLSGSEQPDQPVEIVLEGAGGITGRVLDAATEAAVTDATITIGDSQTETETNSSGDFAIQSLPVGGYQLTIVADGYPAKTLDAQATVEPKGVIVRLEGSAALKGLVYDAYSKQPIEGARLILADLKQNTATDQTGLYAMERLPGRPVTVVATAPNYGKFEQAVQLEPGTEQRLDVALGGACSLSGTIVDDVTDRPISEATVRLSVGSCVAQTDSDGNFSFDGLFPGALKLHASAPGYTAFLQEDLNLEQDEEKSLHLKLRGNAALAGRVVRKGTTTPISGASVRVADSRYKTETDTSGRFQFEAIPGTQTTLECSADGYAPSSTSWNLPPNQRSAVELELERRTVLTGRLVDATNNEPIRNATIRIRGTGLSTESDSDGHFRLDDVRQDKVTLEIEAPGFRPIVSEVTTEGEMFDFREALSPILKPGEVRIVLTWDARPADLDAHLTGPKPNGGTFHVNHKVKRDTLVRLDTDARSGHGPETITVEKLIPGNYRYVVHNYIDQKSTQTPTPLSKSDAEVRVYVGEETHSFQVDPKTDSTTWNVCEFQLSGSRLNIRKVDTYSNVQP